MYCNVEVEFTVETQQTADNPCHFSCATVTDLGSIQCAESIALSVHRI